MIRAYDIDGVLANFTDGHRKAIHEVAGVVMPPTTDTYPDVWDYHLELGLSEKQLADIWEHIRETDFWETLAPAKNGVVALSMIRHQRKAGDRIYFITDRKGSYAKHLTEFWLDSNGYECPTVLLTGDKGPVCKALGVELFVDDRPSNCLDVATRCPQAKVFLLDAPYNRNTGIEESCPNVTRVQSILDPRIMGGCPIVVS